MKVSIFINGYLLFLIICSLSCKNTSENLTESGFNVLMQNIAEGWSTQNTTLALSSFCEDAVYMQPPNIQFYRGHSQLQPFFNELTSEYKMVFHNLWFDENNQTGVGEFTFSYEKDTADVGIVIVELENGKINFWREYLIKGPTNFEDFLKIKNKNWIWHIGNYPEPKDTSNQ